MVSFVQPGDQQVVEEDEQDPVHFLQGDVLLHQRVTQKQLVGPEAERGRLADAPHEQGVDSEDANRAGGAGEIRR